MTDSIPRVDDVNRPDLSPKKAFILGALDKEIRLAFASRIRSTLPEEYHPLIPQSRENDIPEFKYNNECKYWRHYTTQCVTDERIK